MNKPQIFFRLTKFDEIKGEVTGIATAELPDQTGEICDYETTKPFYQKWSDRVSKATKGKSLGNVREMHSNIAAGKIIDLVFDDVAKTIVITAKVVDPVSLNKVREGVLTGFSQGGDYIKKWKDGEFMRYTADPSEVSLVDNPCLSEATFEVIKSDGSKELRKFTPKAVPKELEQVWRAKDGSTHATKAEASAHNTLLDARETVAKATEEAEALLNDIENDLDKREFSDDERKKAADAGEAMPDGSFPIKSDQDLKNAVRAVGRASDPAKAKEHIISRAKAMGSTHLLPSEWEGSTKDSKKAKTAEDLKKGLGTLGRAANLVQELEWLCNSIKQEEVWEDDDSSTAPDHLEEIIKELCDFLCNYCEEETAEMVEAHGGTGIEDSIMEMAAGHAGALAKILKHQTYAGKELTRANELFASLEKAAAVKKEEMEMSAGMMDHVHAIHKGASNIMKRCMKCMGTDAEKILKSDDGENETNDHLKAIHKKAADIAHRAVQMGSDADDESGEADDEGAEKMRKIATENTEFKKSIATLTTQLTEVSKRLKTVEDQPAARKGVTMVVKKGHELEEEPEHTADEPQTFNMNGLSPAEARSALNPQRR